MKSLRSGDRVSDGGTSLQLTRIDDLAELEADWKGLAEATGHPFATWEWNSLWWKHFGAGRELNVFVGRDEAGRTHLILPLYVAATRPIRVARLLGYADFQSPICRPEHRALAGAALREVTHRSDACRLVYAERLPGDQGWEQSIGGREVLVGAAPVLPFGGRTWEDILASKKRKFRGNLRRAEQKLVEEHGLAFTLVEDPAQLEPALESLFSLHRQRWGDETTGVFEGERAAFHRDFAKAALERGWLRLWIAEVDGNPAAAWYGWRYAGSEWFFQSGRDPSLDPLSVGSVLLVQAMREACGDGMETFQFLAGNESYKGRFAETDRRQRTIAVGGGLVGRAGARVLAAGARPGSAPRRLAQRVTR